VNTSIMAAMSSFYCILYQSNIYLDLKNYLSNFCYIVSPILLSSAVHMVTSWLLWQLLQQNVFQLIALAHICHIYIYPVEARWQFACNPEEPLCHPLSHCTCM